MGMETKIGCPDVQAGEVKSPRLIEITIVTGVMVLSLSIEGTCSLVLCFVVSSRCISTNWLLVELSHWVQESDFLYGPEWLL